MNLNSLKKQTNYYFFTNQRKQYTMVVLQYTSLLMTFKQFELSSLQRKEAKVQWWALRETAAELNISDISCADTRLKVKTKTINPNHTLNNNATVRKSQ